MKPQQEQSGDNTTVQSLVRGLAVIRSFGTERPRQTLSEVAEETGLARATARRFLHTLVTLGYADTDGSTFWLTPRILELGFSYLSALELPSIAQPRLEQLSRSIKESSSLSVLDGTDIVYVNRVPVRKIMTVSITIGTRFPAFATSMGRVLLADLPESELEEYWANADLSSLTPQTITAREKLNSQLQAVRDQGFAIVDQELEPGLRSVAAPIYSPAGKVIAAINVSTQSALRTTEDIKRTIVPELLETARAITTDLKSTTY
ncbi:IclR family transcriptional regulator domain-containing protein [Corynebacterium hindlerae]|uniref:IclR family transcriptional regulator domain-containing protein n=1 Tax=Corynebacterium hindlerae TaxID=699041 RepID=UPI001FCB6A03|nr:IclR family transcriptional regulator C-terminal domain-containing protein [Corynebacterium hindlerae]